MRWLDGITKSMDMSLLTLGVGDGQGGLVCYSPRGHKELKKTERLNRTEKHVQETHIDMKRCWTDWLLRLRQRPELGRR